jgi:hypothetical protein
MLGQRFVIRKRGSISDDIRDAEEPDDRLLPARNSFRAAGPL